MSNLYQRIDKALSIKDVDNWNNELNDMDGYRPQQRVHIVIPHDIEKEELYVLLDTAMAFVAVYNAITYSIDMTLAEFNSYMEADRFSGDGTPISTHIRILSEIMDLEMEQISIESGLEADRWLRTNDFEEVLLFKENEKLIKEVCND